jgi:outer membrane receptor protein involved in Fe transport
VEALPASGNSKSSDETIRGNEQRTIVRWKNWLSNTSITIGCNNVLGQAPPKAYGNRFGNPFGYPAAIYDPTGRFVYVTLRKKF